MGGLYVAATPVLCTRKLLRPRIWAYSTDPKSGPPTLTQNLNLTGQTFPHLEHAGFNL